MGDAPFLFWWLVHLFTECSLSSTGGFVSGRVILFSLFTKKASRRCSRFNYPSLRLALTPRPSPRCVLTNFGKCPFGDATKWSRFPFFQVFFPFFCWDSENDTFPKGLNKWPWFGVKTYIKKTVLKKLRICKGTLHWFLNSLFFFLHSKKPYLN